METIGGNYVLDVALGRNHTVSSRRARACSACLLDRVPACSCMKFEEMAVFSRGMCLFMLLAYVCAQLCVRKYEFAAQK